MYCWGNNRFGHLGLADTEQGDVHFKENDSFHGQPSVQKVACGGRHSLFLLDDGIVLSCGQNLCGQLGRKNNISSLEQIHALEAQTIVDVSCGSNHSVAICNEGNVFTWGEGTHGQLGSGQFPQQTPSPRRITGLSDIKIIQISCGHYHTIALSEDSNVFSWGKNDVGQLGLGNQIADHASPQLVKFLKGVPLVQVTAGGSQSFALSKLGIVFGWGKNNAGQLGFESDPQKGVFRPKAVSSLRFLSVVYISCGDEHTAVLSKDGTVYTFGDGSYGQLGDSSVAHTSVPQKIEEYEGQISQVACGSYHTLLYVFTSNHVVSFGHGLPRNPDTSGCDEDQPPQLTLPLDTSSMFTPSDFSDIHVKQIFAGNNVSFVTSSLQAQNHTLLSETLKKICQLNSTIVMKWTDTKPGKGKHHNAKREISKVFSSPACLTANFLRHRSSPSEICPSVDLEAANTLFTELCKNRWISDLICSSLKNDLIPAIEGLPTIFEALSVYLLLAECPVTHDVNTCLQLVAPFAFAINNLSSNALKMLETLWSSLPALSLSKQVQMFKISLVLAVYGQEHFIKDLLEVLKKLFKANKKASYKVPIAFFCVPEVSDIIIIPVDLNNWRLWQKATEAEQDALPPIYYRFPFIFTFATKVHYLHFDASLKKNEVKLQASQMLVLNRMNHSSDSPRIPLLHLKIRRQNLLEDTMHKLSIVEDCDLKKELLVEFHGETGADTRAVISEFFLFVAEKMVHPDYGLFTCSEPLLPVWFPSQASAEKKNYYYYGILCGLAIYNQIVMYMPFPLALFKKLLGKKTTIDDLKELQPTMGRSMQILLATEKDVESLELYFTLCWENKTIELIPNGASERVTNLNKHDYINKCIDYIFNTSVVETFEEFRRGLYKICNKDIFSFFQPRELMELASGHANYDWKIFEQNTIYIGKYSPNHPTITMFWNVFHKLPLKKKKGFLYFVTGNDKIPVFGIGNIRMKISSFGVPQENYLPEAQPCSWLLLLPEYSNTKVLRSKLLLAIENNKGFNRI
ncbi:probable E3 ubiquitin-protein ligase HERC6 isoform X2 [Pseudophryne corroboree]|uniref:probable E3 ubiquitin-protein ligase HERC6 isoform X2 n=1 Tax=Pseudophryne corroboree TaxID=495146 RepID=UPI00308163FA